jgi:hypothetical protein
MLTSLHSIFILNQPDAFSDTTQSQTYLTTPIMDTLKSAIASVTHSPKPLLRLRGSVQDYDWGKPGSTSLVAKLAPEAVGPDFKVNADHHYAEVSIPFVSHPIIQAELESFRYGWVHTRTDQHHSSPSLRRPCHL